MQKVFTRLVNLLLARRQPHVDLFNPPRHLAAVVSEPADPIQVDEADQIAGQVTFGTPDRLLHLVNLGLKDHALTQHLGQFALAAIFGQIDLSGVGNGPLIAVPQLFPFGMPKFDLIAALPLIVFSIISMASSSIPNSPAIPARTANGNLRTGREP